MGYIYSITNNINQKKYIGLTTKANPYERWKKHLSNSANNSPYAIHSAIRKYGAENFKFRILEECEDNDLKEKEIHYIRLYNTFYEGYNSTPGGDVSYNTNGKPVTQYNKKGIRIRDFASIRDACESIKKEDISPIGRCANGERFSAYGYRWSWKGEKLPIIKTKYLLPIYAYNKDGMYKEWCSKNEASRDMNFCRRTITQSLDSPTNNKKQCKGWYFFRMEDNKNKVDFSEITFAKRYRPTKEKAREMVNIKKRGFLHPLS